MTDPIEDLWTRQHADARPPEPAALARAQARLRRRLWRRDAIEYGAGLLVIGVLVDAAVKIPDWGVRIGVAMVVIGVVVVMANLWRRRWRTPDDGLGEPGLAFFRAQLVAQRDALATVWRWYIGPVVPGVLAFMIAVAHATAQHMPLWAALGGTGLVATPVVVIFYAIYRLNRRAARFLQQKIEALDRGEIWPS